MKDKCVNCEKLKKEINLQHKVLDLAAKTVKLVHKQQILEAKKQISRATAVIETAKKYGLMN